MVDLTLVKLEGQFFPFSFNHVFRFLFFSFFFSFLLHCVPCCDERGFAEEHRARVRACVRPCVSGFPCADLDDRSYSFHKLHRSCRERSNSPLPSLSARGVVLFPLSPACLLWAFCSCHQGWIILSGARSERVGEIKISGPGGEEKLKILLHFSDLLIPYVSVISISSFSHLIPSCFLAFFEAVVLPFLVLAYGAKCRSGWSFFFFLGFTKLLKA